MSDRAATLLLKALRLLEQEEQDEVVASLLSARLSASDPLQGLGFLGAATVAAPMDAERAVRVVRLFGVDPGAVTGTEARLKVLPVRLPVADHDRLREWSAQHGFSMAVVIRALLERFLEEQQAGDSPAKKTEHP